MKSTGIFVLCREFIDISSFQMSLWIQHRNK